MSLCLAVFDHQQSIKNTLFKLNKSVIMSFKGKTIILTGASKGIGRALAINLAKQGANLSLVARSKDELKAVQAECKTAGA